MNLRIIFFFFKKKVRNLGDNRLKLSFFLYLEFNFNQLLKNKQSKFNDIFIIEYFNNEKPTI